MTRRDDRIELLRGTLDMLILRTLVVGPAHGHQIAKHIQRSTDDVLQVEHGSLYPALHRLERKGWLIARWESLDAKREFKYSPVERGWQETVDGRRIEVGAVGDRHRARRRAGTGIEVTHGHLVTFLRDTKIACAAGG